MMIMLMMLMIFMMFSKVLLLLITITHRSISHHYHLPIHPFIHSCIHPSISHSRDRQQAIATECRSEDY